MRVDGAMKEQEVPPRASALVESLRDIGYSLQTALADVIDNSVTAGARKIELFAETHTESPSIGILDDGTGMDRSELLEAMRPGSRNPLRIGRQPISAASAWGSRRHPSPNAAG